MRPESHEAAGSQESHDHRAPQEIRAAGPGRPELDEFRRAGALAIDAIADYHATLDRRPVLPPVTPAGVAELFRDELPDEGVPAEELIADWQRRVLPNLTAVGSPRHFAFVNGSGTLVGALADALAGATATSTSSWRLGPAAVEIERQTIRWIARFVGYPESTGGLLVSGGTMANFTALTAALRHVAPYDSTALGLQNPCRRGRFLLYMSDHEGHASVTSVADMMNLGRHSVRLVPSRRDLTIDPAALDRMIAEDRRRGDLPFAVVAQLGSVNVGAVDPLEELAEVCARHGVWLHGDGACGLLLAGVPETRDLFRGLERLDSVSVDAHKLLGVPYDCGVVLVREAERLRRAFSLSAPYLRGDSPDGEELDYLDYGPQMSRGFRALKVWMTLRHFGAEGLRRQLARNVALARRLHQLVADHPDFEVVHEPRLFLYCCRFRPYALAGRRGAEAGAEELIDQLNQRIANLVQASGLALVMTSRVRGRVVLRFSICSHRTREQDIDRTFDAVARIGRGLVPEALTGLPARCRVA